MTAWLRLLWYVILLSISWFVLFPVALWAIVWCSKTIGVWWINSIGMWWVYWLQ